MKIKLLINGLFVLFLGLIASTAMACNCGKKSQTGQPSACSCGSSCTETACSDSPANSSQGATDQEKKETEPTAVDIGNKICPVSGNPVDSMGEAVTYTHEGKIYHLCCAGCIDKFKMELEYFIKKIEVIEKTTNNNK